MRAVWKSLTWVTCFAAVLNGSLSLSAVADPAHSLLTSFNTQLRQRGRGLVEPKIEEGYIPVDDGIRLFYRKVGHGRDTVVVPLGFYLYKDFKQLASNRTIIFYDMRNRGRSSAVAAGEKITIQHDVEDLEKVRQHFGLERMNLIGESYLGLMVMMYAMKYPEHVGRI